MVKVGLTGGIGSGKSTVAKVFELIGIPVYRADEKAKSIMHANAKVVKAIIDLLGENAYTKGILNRGFVAEKVFNNKELLAQLNQIVHPAVGKDWVDWCELHKKEEVVVQEAAILFENGSYKKFDQLILVTAPLELRIERVLLRDNVDRNKVLERINNQWDDEKKGELADVIIINDDRHSLIKQTLHFISDYGILG